LNLGSLKLDLHNWINKDVAWSLLRKWGHSLKTLELTRFKEFMPRWYHDQEATTENSGFGKPLFPLNTPVYLPKLSKLTIFCGLLPRTFHFLNQFPQLKVFCLGDDKFPAVATFRQMIANTTTMEPLTNLEEFRVGDDKCVLDDSCCCCHATNTDEEYSKFQTWFPNVEVCRTQYLGQYDGEEA